MTSAERIEERAKMFHEAALVALKKHYDAVSLQGFKQPTWTELEEQDKAVARDLARLTFKLERDAAMRQWDDTTRFPTRDEIDDYYAGLVPEETE